MTPLIFHLPVYYHLALSQIPVMYQDEKQLFFIQTPENYPIPGSDEELARFHKIQESFTRQFELFFPDNLAPKTIVVVPSLTLDREVLSKISGVQHYEERLLCLLMLLRMPRTQVIFISSTPIDPVIIDYYLHLLPGITGYHARERLKLLSCYDTSEISLTEKILSRPKLIERIKRSIPAEHVAHIACFNTSGFERTLAVRLGLPIYGCDPSLIHYGNKSGGRRIFAIAGVPMPPGVENLRTYKDIVDAVCALKDMYPHFKKAVLKMNDGFSGEGNALIRYPEGLTSRELFDWIHQNLFREIIPVAKELSTAEYLRKFEEMGGIVEGFIESEVKSSPSVQCRIDPLGKVSLISTHDQVLDGQIFIGALFPADNSYSESISKLSRAIAGTLRDAGVLGRFSIDFVSVLQNGKWQHYAIEINLRKGGTTHPYLMLQYLTNGNYDEYSGTFLTPNKQNLYYFASDNLQNDAYKGLTPPDLMDIAMLHGLHYDGSAQKGVVFHMIGALSEWGKIGILCIGSSPAEANSYYQKTIQVLNAETRRRQ